VNVTFECFGVVEAVDEEEFFAVGQEWFEDLAQLHLGAGAARPPVIFVEPIAGEEDGEAEGGVCGGFAGGVLSEDADGFEPREGHGDAGSAEDGAAGGVAGWHGRILWSGVCGVLFGKFKSDAVDHLPEIFEGGFVEVAKVAAIE